MSIARIISFDWYPEFIKYNEKTLIENYLNYYYFHIIYNMIERREIKPLDFYNIVDNDNKSAICLLTEHGYNLYSENWSDEMLKLAVEKIDFSRFKRFTFTGSREFLLAIFKQAKLQINIIKDRIIYKCESIKNINLDNNLIIRNATIYDFQDVSLMSNMFYQEEYSGKGTTTSSEINMRSQVGINKGNIYVAEKDGKIYSMLQIINYEREIPIIGGVFTKPVYRNRGLAKQLLYKVTEGLLNNGYPYCGLFSDAQVEYSNKAFLSVGYTPTYKLVYLSKEL